MLLASLKRWFSLRSADSVGRDVVLRGRLSTESYGRLLIGDGVQIGGGSATTHLVTSKGATLKIGARSTVGHGSGISATTGVSIGNDVHIGPFCLVLDNDFHVVGNRDAAPECAPIRIDDGAVLGARVVVLRGSHIGCGARVAAGSVVSGIVTAHTTVAGVPARVLRLDVQEGTVESLAVLDDEVCEMLARTLGLSAVPSVDAVLNDVEEWDSLAMLNVLLSLEERYAIALSPDAFVRLRTIAELVAVTRDAVNERH